MAQRRMFSLKIIDSAKFLKMPSSSRLLYYDLCMRADDDGVVEGFNVLRMTGATEDDLKVLISKDFIKVLNEDLVSYIIDWKEHNKIRSDRKVNSIYKDLLLQVIPEAKLIEPRERADSNKKSGNNKKTVDQWTSNGQPNGGIGKDRLGKVSIGEVSTTTANLESCSSDFNIFKYAEQRNFILSAIQIQQIQGDIEIYSLEEVKKALDIADDNGKHIYSYVKGILEKRRAGINEKNRSQSQLERLIQKSEETGEDPF